MEEKSSMREIIGGRIKEARKKRGLTQEALASKVDDYEGRDESRVAQSTIASWENGLSSPSFERLRTVSEILNCDISYLLGESPCLRISDVQISEYTGLKEETISKLHDYTTRKGYKGENYKRVASFLDSLIECKDFHYICVLFENHESDKRKYKNASLAYENYLKGMAGKSPIATKEDYKEHLKRQCKESEFKFLLEISKWLGE